MRSPILALVASVCLATTAASVIGPQSPTVAASPTVQESNAFGFDSCKRQNEWPTVSDMAAFWSGTPYYEYLMYLGGSTAYCGATNSGITSSWVSQVIQQGWGLAGLWVGPQCCGGAGFISTNTSTAYQQGVNEANAAANEWCNLGLCYGLPEPIIYDFESDTDPTAEHAFLSGWISQLHSRLFSAGAYASTCNPTDEVQNWRLLSPPPDFVDAAAWDGRGTVWLQSGWCLSNSYWVYDQRFHQYQKTHNVTYNNVTLPIDSDCANAPVFGEWFTYLDVESGDGGYGEDPYDCQ
jgi:Rv2525c-like, glycoside hydrolase-like domain